MTSLDAYLALSLLPKIGPVRIRKLLDVFSTPEAILSAPASALRKVQGIGPEMANVVSGWENHIDLEEEKRRIRDHEIELVTLDCDDYPPLLRGIHDPPVLLFVKGRLDPRDRQAIAVIGSRRATHYGRDAARKLSYQLAGAGLTVISGLARGIDTAAHEAALAAGGRTIAVLGSGIGHLYPPENAALAESIAEQGAVISEYPVLYVPDRQSFPLRNLIVSGMSHGILVVEAPGRSGALITAQQALEQGRSVFAVPGPIDRETSLGANRLIQSGARLVLQGSDILEDLEWLPSFLPSPPQTVKGAPPSDAEPAVTPSLSPEEHRVMEALESPESSIDGLIERCRMPAAAVSVLLLQLEMKGLVRSLPGKNYAKLI